VNETLDGVALLHPPISTAKSSPAERRGRLIILETFSGLLSRTTRGVGHWQRNEYRPRHTGGVAA